MPGGCALEALAIEGNVPTPYEAGRLLRLSRIEFDGASQASSIDEHGFDVEDLERDIETLERFQLLA